MDAKLKKAVRTLQSELPFLKRAKDSFYLHTRRMLRQPHENDFRALALIPDGQDRCYIDIGANQGQSIESILLFKPSAQLISFEPNPNLAMALANRYKIKTNISIVAQGLSDAPGELTLFVPSYKGFVYDALASLDRDAAASWISEQTVLGFTPDKLTIDETRCEVNTLDSHQLAPIFIKIDVQGHEYNVLNGGRETLRRYEPILLIETFRGDFRTVRLAEEMGYEEYYFDDSRLRKGESKNGPNSFLLTPGRARVMFE